MEEDKRTFLKFERGPGKRQIKPTAVAFEALPGENEEDDADFDDPNDEDDSCTSSESFVDGENMIMDDDEEEELAHDTTVDGSDLFQDGASNSQRSSQPSQAKKEEPPVCCICLKFDSETLKVFKCARCNIYVHDCCYGITDDNKIKNSSTGESNLFLCEPCIFGLIEPPYCELCPSRYGAFKKTDIGSNWVCFCPRAQVHIHVICGLYVPNITYECTQNFIGISYQELDHKRFGKKACNGCSNDAYENRTGIVVPCEAGLCKLNYHTTCAQRLGLLVERGAADENENENHGHLLCKRHSDDDIVKHRKKMYTKMMIQEENRMIHIKKQKISEEHLAQKQKQLDNWRQIIEKDEFNNVVYPNPKTPKRIRMFQTSAEFMDGFAMKAEMAFGIDRKNFDKEMLEIPDEKLKLGDAMTFTVNSTRHFDYREDTVIPDLETRAQELICSKEDVLQRIEDEKKDIAIYKETAETFKVTAKSFVDICSDFVDSLNSFGAKEIEKIVWPAAIAEKLQTKIQPTTSSAAENQKPKLKAALPSKKTGKNVNPGMTKNNDSSARPRLGSSKDIAVLKDRNSRKRPLSSASEVAKICFKCKNDTDIHRMLFCDSCEHYFHISCLEPPLIKMPKQSQYFIFQCSECFEKEMTAKMEVKEPTERCQRSCRRDKNQ